MGKNQGKVEVGGSKAIGPEERQESVALGQAGRMEGRKKQATSWKGKRFAGDRRLGRRQAN